MQESGFGAAVCKKNGWNYVFVGKSRLSNFVSLSLDRFAEALAPLLPGRDVIAYETSAGGNAALFFGGVIDARILSASPRDAKNKPGYVLPIAATRASRHDPVIVYDFRQVRDATRVSEWVNLHYPRARLYDVPNSGHQSLARLKQAGTLSHLVKSFVNRQDIAEDSLRFPEGTAERRLDDATLGLSRGEFAQTLTALERDGEFAGHPKLLHIYIECAARAGGADQRRRLQELVASGAIRPQELGGRDSRHLRSILGDGPEGTGQL